MTGQDQPAGTFAEYRDQVGLVGASRQRVSDGQLALLGPGDELRLANPNDASTRLLLIAGTPLGRFGRPEDIAPIAVFLASPEAGWLTGQIVLAGGGLH